MKAKAFPTEIGPSVGDSMPVSYNGGEWKPTAADMQVALHETIRYFSEGKLTEAELDWAVSFLAAELVQLQLAEALDSFGRSILEGPGFSVNGSKTPLYSSL